METDVIKTEEENEKAKVKALADGFIKFLKEFLRRVFLGKPVYADVIKEMEKNLEEMTFQNAVTSEMLNDLYTVVSEVRGNIDNMTVEEGEKYLNDISQKLADARHKVEMKAVDDVILDENGIEKTDYAIFTKFNAPLGVNDVFLAHVDSKGKIDGSMYRVAVAETMSDKRSVFVTDEVTDIQKSNLDDFERVELYNDLDITRGDQIKVTLASLLLGSDSVDEYVQYYKSIHKLESKQDILLNKHTVLSDMSYLAVTSGNIKSYINSENKYCVADLLNHKVIVFTSDINREVANIMDCDDEGMPLKGSEPEIIGIWQGAGNGKIEGIVTYDRQYIRYHLLNFDATSKYLESRNIHLEPPSNNEKKQYIRPVTNKGNDTIYKIYDKMSNAKQNNVINQNWNIKCSNNTIEVITDKGESTLFTFSEDGYPEDVRHRNSNGKDYEKTHKIDLNALEAITAMGMDISMPEDLRISTNLFLSATKDMFLDEKGIKSIDNER